MRVILTNNAKKQFSQLNEPHKGRISEAINKLRNDPPEGDIIKLVGRVGYRVREGNYRIFFDIDKNLKIINVFEIDLRGEAYKKKNKR